jgi:outer membrane protein assembly factor BamB
MRKLHVALSLGILLAACASDNVEPPAPLTPILKPSYTASEEWTRYIPSSDAVLRVDLGAASDSNLVFTATYSGSVYAFSLHSGYTEWHVKTGLALGAGPVVKDGMVVVASSGGTVFALKASDGTTLWKTELDGEVVDRPAIGAGSVIVRTTDGRVVALAADSGKQRWKIAYDEPRLTLRGACEPLIVDRTVYVGLDDGKLVALSIDDGSQLWAATVGTSKGSDELSRLTDVDGMLATDGDEIFAVAYRGQAVAVSRANGQVMWSRDLASYTGATTDGQNVYVTDLHSAVWALNKDTGTPVWTQPVLRAHDLTAAVPYKDSVIVGGIDGHFHFLSRKDGSLMAREQLGGAPILSPPLVVGDLVVILSTGGRISAYRITPAKGG